MHLGEALQREAELNGPPSDAAGPFPLLLAAPSTSLWPFGKTFATMRRLSPLALALVLLPLPAASHQSIWDPGMFAFNGPTGCNQANGDCESLQVNPLVPGLATQADWWFRGPTYTSALPDPSNATVLPAGGSWSTEITCHKAWSKYGATPTADNAALSCCPNGVPTMPTRPASSSTTPSFLDVLWQSPT